VAALWMADSPMRKCGGTVQHCASAQRLHFQTASLLERGRVAQKASRLFVGCVGVSCHVDLAVPGWACIPLSKSL